MSADTILIVLLVIVAMRPFFELPNSNAKGRAQAKGGYKSNPSQGCMYVLLLPIMLGLWWWFALITDQVLLGVIPTVGTSVGLLVLWLEASARKAEGKKR